MLSRAERGVAIPVFGESITWRRVLVTPYSGLAGRPFTTTLPPFSPVAFAYVLNVGPDGHAGMERSRSLRGLLIHELTHVWQGESGLLRSGFMVRSILHQALAALRRRSAYAYAPGRPFSGMRSS